MLSALESRGDARHPCHDRGWHLPLAPPPPPAHAAPDSCALGLDGLPNASTGIAGFGDLFTTQADGRRGFFLFLFSLVFVLLTLLMKERGRERSRDRAKVTGPGSRLQSGLSPGSDAPRAGYLLRARRKRNKAPQVCALELPFDLLSGFLSLLPPGPPPGIPNPSKRPCLSQGAGQEASQGGLRAGMLDRPYTLHVSSGSWVGLCSWQDKQSWFRRPQRLG